MLQIVITEIGKILSKVIVAFNGGMWNIKKKLNIIKNKYILSLYLSAYEKELAKKGSWIGYNSYFKGMPIFPHGILSIFISGDSHIGKNCVIFQQVTIGSNTLMDSRKKGSPCIGDNCYIGAGAKIIGGVRIGNNCRIGANCVVVDNMPDNSVAVLQQTRIIQKTDLNNKYYTKGTDGWYYYDDGRKIKDINFKYGSDVKINC